MRRGLVEKIKGRIVFLDLDGTLSEYRYNNHISGGDGRRGQTFEELFFGDVFINSRPLETMVDVVRELDPSRIYVLGAITTNHEIDEKYKWLEKYYPSIKRENVIFIAGSDLKLVAIQQYMNRLGVSKEDIVFIDDKHSTLREVEDAGFTSYHMTSFVD
ncbi:hypothetical protein FWH09_02335 [Candidatus Saccharibacteria bacterium]|nr:hypothetical protein [Candidatus Saccharibacteria bacterium]